MFISSPSIEIVGSKKLAFFAGSSNFHSKIPNLFASLLKLSNVGPQGQPIHTPIMSSMNPMNSIRLILNFEIKAFIL